MSVWLWAQVQEVLRSIGRAPTVRRESSSAHRGHNVREVLSIQIGDGVRKNFRCIHRRRRTHIRDGLL